MSAINNIAVDPITQKFSEGQDSRFDAYLTDLDRCSLLHRLYSPEQLLLKEDMLVSDQYRYTWPAIANISRRMLYGGHYTVLNLSGYYGSFNYRSNASSIRDAAFVFNTVVRNRFDTFFKGKKLLKNTDTQTIEGLLTRKRSLVTSSSLYSKFKSKLDSLGVNHRLKLAVADGRHTQVRVLTDVVSDLTSSLFTTAQLGIAIENNEVFSKNVRCCLFVDLPPFGQLVLGLKDNYKVGHSDEDFDGAFSQMLTDIVASVRNFDFSSFNSRLVNLEGMTLGLKNNKLENCASQLVMYRFMHYNGIPKTQASAILAKTIRGNGDFSSFIEERKNTNREISGRSHAHLLKHLIQETDSASSLPLRNTIDMVAHRVFKKGFTNVK
jgi:hypothetical protein